MDAVGLQGRAVFSSLPSFRGKTGIGRRLFRKMIKESTDLWVLGKFGCRYFLPNLKEVVALDIFLNGIYEIETHEFLMKQVPQGAVILDIGANIGSISIPLMKRRKDISCIGVEASPFVFNYLKQNVLENGLASRFVCVNKAIADRSGQTVSFYSAPENFGKGSLAPVYSNEAVQVQTTTMADLMDESGLPRVDFIKADIEGFEYFAFNGGWNFLERPDAPPILFEFVDWAEKNAHLSPGSSQQLLADLGYDLFLLQKKNHLKRTDPLHDGSVMLYAIKNNAA